jgi:hypothetical protein
MGMRLSRRPATATRTLACQALERRATVAKLKAGEPVFSAVDQRQIISREPLTDRSVARIVKARVDASRILVRT